MQIVNYYIECLFPTCFLSMCPQQGKETQLLHVFEEDLILGNEKKDDCSQELPPAENSRVTFRKAI